MTTIITHMAIPLAIGLGLGKSAISRRLLAAGMVASILPDADVLAFKIGIAYGSDFGHRGFSHSLLFAVAVGLLGAAAYSFLRSSPAKAFLFLMLATASHGILDAFTNGGHGVAFLWPVSSERFFFPFQVIEVSPIGLSRFLSMRGLEVLKSEAIWVWLPCVVACAILWAGRFAIRRSPNRQGSLNE